MHRLQHAAFSGCPLPCVAEHLQRIGSAVAAHKGAPRFRQRLALRRKLGKELPRGSVGEALARGLLDSDCESCSGRRRTSHITAAVRATDYVHKVRAALAAKRAATAAAAAVILTEDEEDGEEVWIEEDEDSDPGHVPLGKKGPDDPPMGLEASKVVWGRRSP